MIKNIIFDMDGVLLDSENGIRTACIMMLEKHGVTAQHEDFVPFTGMGENRFIGGVCEKYGIEFHTDMKAEAYKIYADIAQEYVIVYEGIKALVLKLRALGYKTAVASSADAIKVNINLDCMGLSRQDFDGVVTGSDVERNKPFPDIFLAAAKMIGADPAESLVIEDAISGCKAAIAAGMRCVGIITSTFDGSELLKAGAERIIPKTVELLDLLDEL